MNMLDHINCISKSSFSAHCFMLLVYFNSWLVYVPKQKSYIASTRLKCLMSDLGYTHCNILNTLKSIPYNQFYLELFSIGD